MLERITDLLEDEKQAFEFMSGLRGAYSPERFADVPVDTTDEAIARGIDIVKNTLRQYKGLGINIRDLCAGHGVGHLSRDYINALILSGKINADPRHILVGFAGGVLHDLGCAVQERYLDSKRAVRHAEAGAILFHESTTDIGMSKAERDLIAYSIAAHTHYLKPGEVQCTDGVTRKIEPYPDTDADGKPVLGVWMPRWVDRLDCNGPTMVGRHYLTLSRPRQEFDGKSFYDISFDSSMKPLLRSEAEIKADGGNRTMLEHFRMFADSQNNQSPYGRFDSSEMVEIRDRHTEMLRGIINSVKIAAAAHSEVDCQAVDDWHGLLYSNIEPSEQGKEVANVLKEMFFALGKDSQAAWSHGFVQTGKEYLQYASEKLQALDDIISGRMLPADSYFLPLIDLDIRKVLLPVS